MTAGFLMFGFSCAYFVGFRLLILVLGGGCWCNASGLAWLCIWFVFWLGV